MQYASLILFALALVPPVLQAAEKSFPYQAVVKQDGAQVRSGPDKNAYPTEKLPQGFVVEVYRHDPGGWCAIRPTPESFSWVAAKSVDVGKDGIATAKSSKGTVYVGSTLTESREAHQVKLQPGEQVEVIGGDENWYKILPPSGEFRWISSRVIERIDASEMREATETPVASHKSRVKSKSRHETDPDAEDTSIHTDLVDNRPHTRGLSNPGAKIRSATFDEKLADVNTRLSASVLGEPTQWQLDDIRRQANSLLDEADNTLDRGKARLVVSQIDRFDDIRDRQVALYQNRQVADRRLRRESTESIARISTDNRYDAIGRLQRVAPRGMDTPQFAIVDQNGGVLSYVNPSPGVNLQAYQNMQVGVNGTKNYLASAQKPLIQVQRVTVVADAQPLYR
jgi:SH3-like domain-containing protein